MNPLDTTVVGSFPVLPFYPVKQDYPPYTDEIPEDEVYMDDPFLPGIFEALQLQDRAGIDYPSYGQPQDMCAMFLGYLIDHGLEYTNGFQVTGDIEIPKSIPAIEYLQVAKKYFTFKGVKMPLTGPITLAASVKVGEKPGIEYPEIVEQLANFVSHIAGAYDRGAAIISVDEPSLVYALYTGMEPDFITEVLNKSLKPVRNAVSSTHVCGQLSTSITDILLSTTATVLDHEFSGIPQNVKLYKRDDLESSKKLLGFGCVETNIEPALLIEVQKTGDWRSVVEPVPVVEKRIHTAIDRWGKENIILDPDCGFGGLRNYIDRKLTKEVALAICYEKLKNMVDAKRGIA